MNIKYYIKNGRLIFPKSPLYCYDNNLTKSKYRP